MDRFYSSLDVRDIRVGPESSFPPDATQQAAGPADEAGPSDGAPLTAAEPETPVRRDVLKVSAKSRPSAVAGAIAGVVRLAKRAEVQAIGAGATNQAVKAIAIARDYLAEEKIDLVCIPEFIDIIIEAEERTAIRFIIEPR